LNTLALAPQYKGCVKMKKIYYFALLSLFVTYLSISGTVLALEPFSDDFERTDSADVGNGWTDDEDAGISVSLVGGEVLIEGEQETDWDRDGISRDVDDISSLYFDFLANDSFNIHMRIDDTANGAYMDIYAPPGGSFSYANSVDGGWPGWTQVPDSQMIADEYNTLGIEKVSANSYQMKLNGADMGEVLENAGLTTIDSILLSVDSAAGTTGSAHIDNVVIDGGMAPVQPSDKLSTSWGRIKDLL
jgi:hypothetical protein